MKNVDIDYISLLQGREKPDAGIFEFKKSYHQTNGLEIQFANCQIPGVLISNWKANCHGPASFTAEMAPEAVNMNFMLEGGMQSNLHANNSDFFINNRQHNLIYLDSFDGSHKLCNGNTSAFHLMFDINFFRSLIDYNEPQTAPFLEKIDKKQGFFANKYMMPVTPEMFKIISEMLSCKLSGAFKAIFLQGKSLELLSHTLAQASVYSPALTTVSSRDTQLLHQIREYLDNNYLNPVSILEICKMFGLNDHKLKQGFRQLFQTSVFAYTHHKRMELAEQLIKDGQMPVIEIAELLGYEHANHFSTAFKKHFGFPPRTLRLSASSYWPQ